MCINCRNEVNSLDEQFTGCYLIGRYKVVYTRQSECWIVFLLEPCSPVCASSQVRAQYCFTTNVSNYEIGERISGQIIMLHFCCSLLKNTFVQIKTGAEAQIVQLRKPTLYKAALKRFFSTYTNL